MQFSRHAFSAYDQDVADLMQKLEQMAQAADALMVVLADALEGHTIDREQTKLLDKQIKKLEYEAINSLHTILSKYTPSQSELKFLLSLVRVSSSLQMLGDITDSNIRRCSRLMAPLPDGIRHQLHEMLHISRTMKDDAVANVFDFKPEMVAELLQRDDEVDSLYAGLLDHIRQNSDNSHFMDLLLIAKYMEKMADHALEIARVSFYQHTGLRPKKKRIMRRAEPAEDETAEAVSAPLH